MDEIFDAHFHIINYQFPLLNINNYRPPEFTVSDYKARTKNLNIKGGVVVSGSFQGLDQSYLQAALKELGPTFAGVIQLPVSVTDDEIMQFDNMGVRAIRFNIKRGGSEDIKHLRNIADRIYQIAKWHVELYVESTHLKDLSALLLSLPKVSIDHLGLLKAGFKNLLVLLEHDIKVKATGFGRLDFDVRQALKEIALANPNALMFGTDLPSTRASRPFLDEDIDLIRHSVDDGLSKKILYSNAVEFYRTECGTQQLPK